jgi:hypothetical protein
MASTANSYIGRRLLREPFNALKRPNCLTKQANPIERGLGRIISTAQNIWRGLQSSRIQAASAAFDTAPCTRLPATHPPPISDLFGAESPGTAL